MSKTSIDLDQTIDIWRYFRHLNQTYALTLYDLTFGYSGLGIDTIKAYAYSDSQPQHCISPSSLEKLVLLYQTVLINRYLQIHHSESVPKETIDIILPKELNVDILKSSTFRLLLEEILDPTPPISPIEITKVDPAIDEQACLVLDPTRGDLLYHLLAFLGAILIASSVLFQSMISHVLYFRLRIVGNFFIMLYCGYLYPFVSDKINVSPKLAARPILYKLFDLFTSGLTLLFSAYKPVSYILSAMFFVTIFIS